MKSGTLLLRSQLKDGQEQAKRDSATIASITIAKREIAEQLYSALCFVEDCEDSEIYKPGIVSRSLSKIRGVLNTYAQ